MNKREMKDLEDKEAIYQRRMRKSTSPLERSRLKKKIARLTKLISWKKD